MAAQYKRQQDSLRKDLKKLLQGEPRGIPLDKLQNSYCKHFHKNLNLKACGIKLSDIIPTFKDILEEVKIDRTKYVRLKGGGSRVKLTAGASAASSSAPSSSGRPTTSQAGAKPKSSNQGQVSGSSSSRRAGPVGITVPQDVINPIQEKKSAEKQTTQAKKSSKDKKTVGRVDAQPGSSIMNPLEYQMEQYISQVRGSQDVSIVGGTYDRGQPPPPGVAGPGYAGHDEPGRMEGGGMPGYLGTGILGATPPGTYFGGTVSTGEFSFDQGSSFYNKFYEQSQDTDTSSSAKQKQATKSAQEKKSKKAEVTSERADPVNWPSLAEAQTSAQSSKSSSSAKGRFKSGNSQHKTTPSSAQQPPSSKPVPLLNLAPSAPKPPPAAAPHSRSSRDHRTYYGRSAYPREQIDDYAQNCIINLAEGGDYVTIDRVMTLVKQHFQVEDIWELGLRGDYELDSIKQLQRLQTKVSFGITFLCPFCDPQHCWEVFHTRSL